MACEAPIAGEAPAREAAEAVARRSYRKLVALLSSQTRDVAGAEDALADAFVAALVDWPAHGVPRTPEAWLLTVARRKWIDALRRRRTAEDAAVHVRLIAEETEARASREGTLPDERVSLLFACAHPAIDPGIRVPLILQTLLGFDAAAIASVYRVAPVAMSQRLVRAKRKIREAGLEFAVHPARAERRSPRPFDQETPCSTKRRSYGSPTSGSPCSTSAWPARRSGT